MEQFYVFWDQFNIDSWFSFSIKTSNINQFYEFCKGNSDIHLIIFYILFIINCLIYQYFFLFKQTSTSPELITYQADYVLITIFYFLKMILFLREESKEVCQNLIEITNKFLQNSTCELVETSKSSKIMEKILKLLSKPNNGILKDFKNLIFKNISKINEKINI